MESLDVPQWLAAYEQGPAELRAAVAGMTREQLMARPVPGRWSSLEVVCHLADSDQFYADRMKRTLAMNRPLLMGADPDPYSAALFYQEHDVEEELSLLDATRRQMLRTLRRVEPAAWDRPAVHSEAGLLTTAQLLSKAVEHLRHHLMFIAEKRRALSA